MLRLGMVLGILVLSSSFFDQRELAKAIVYEKTADSEIADKGDKSKGKYRRDDKKNDKKKDRHHHDDKSRHHKKDRDQDRDRHHSDHGRHSSGKHN